MDHPESGASPADTARAKIPVEVWLRIFEGIDADALLRLSAVNLQLRGWCVEILLSGTAPFGDLPGAKINLILLAALRRSLCNPLSHNITCRFKGPFGTMHLRRLHDIVIQSSELQDLHFEFKRPDYKDEDFVLALNQVIYAMCATTNGNVVAVELPLRRIRCLRMVGQGLRKTYQTEPQQSSECFEQEGVIDWSDKSTAASVTLKCVESSQSGSFTVAIQNTLQGSTIKLGDSGQSGRTTLSGHQLTAILPHITLAHLNALEIHTAEIDPSVLREFLSRHPTVNHISYIPTDHRALVPRTMIPSPLSLPTVTSLRANSTAALRVLVDQIYTSHLPPRETLIELRLIDDGDHVLTNLKSLSESYAPGSPPICLNIILPSSTAPTLSPGAADLAFLRKLHCIKAVTVEGSMENMRAVCPWVRELPQLSLATSEIKWKKAKGDAGRSVLVAG
ncbi:hypothetical protein C8R43DRAFT_961581 [Mycena crocata]|nr:hypothetical protein C8R43DRAFT_961581 [Mycena crocata]